RFEGRLSPSRRLQRQNLARRATERAAGSAISQVRAADQSQSRQLARAHLPARAGRHCRRGKPAFRRGLREVGYVEEQNVVVEYLGVEGQSDRLSGVVTDLIERKVAVIVAVGGTDPAKAAKAAPTTIPIVFISAADPLGAGIVTRLNRPEGNITG